MFKILSTIVDGAKNEVENAGKYVANKVAEGAKDLAEDAWHGIEDGVKFLMDELMKLIKTMANDTVKGAEDIKDYVQYMKSHPSEPLISPKDAIKKMPPNIRPVAELVSGVGKTVEYGKNLANTLEKSYKKEIADIKQTFGKKDKTETKEVAFDKQSCPITEEYPFAPPTSPKPPRPY